MRLDFNVLWVEDQQSNVQSQRAAIDRKLRNEGFRLRTKFAASINEANSNLSDSIYGDHIDLVLMDYDLGAGGRGDTGLEEVRRKFEFKEIIFYSAGATDLAKLVAEKQIQGVFCSTRDNLTEEVFGVFETLVKKVLDIDHARGIVMGTSSDIDGLVFESLHAHFRQVEGKLSDIAKGVIAEQLKEIRKTFEKVAEKVAGAETVGDLYDLHLVYSSAHRHKLLRKLLEKIDEHDAICQAMSLYAGTTMPKRNDLAHIRVEKDGFSRKLFDRKGNELTAEVVRQLRLELLEHQEALEELLEELIKS